MPLSCNPNPIPLHKSATARVIVGLFAVAISAQAPAISKAVEDGKFTRTEAWMLITNISLGVIAALGIKLRIADTNPVYTHPKLPGPNLSDYLETESTVVEAQETSTNH